MHNTLSDDELLSALQNLTLPPSALNHRMHLRIAWIHLQREPLTTAIARIGEELSAFANHHGASGKFNHTLTEALMRLMAAGGAADPNLPWSDFLLANPALLHDPRGLLQRYYSKDLIESPAARGHFLPPDIAPLPL